MAGHSCLCIHVRNNRGQGKIGNTPLFLYPSQDSVAPSWTVGRGTALCRVRQAPLGLMTRPIKATAVTKPCISLEHEPVFVLACACALSLKPF